MKKVNPSQKSLFLSLIIPAYKQERTIKKDLKKIKQVVDKITKNYELIVVVDGKLDKTFEKVKELRLRKVKVFGYSHNHGKGYAVRYGMAKAKGSILAFLDSGMDLDPKSLELLLTVMIAKDADIVIGSKLHPYSKVSYPWQRKILSWGYRNVVKHAFGLTVSDTQVGMKFFKRKVLEDVLPRLLVKRYAFDIEILAVAYRLGYKNIQEAPVTLKYQKWSSITSMNFISTIVKMLWDTAAVYYRLKIVKYYDNRSKRKWRYDPELDFKVNIG